MTDLRKAAESAKQVLENKRLRADEHIIAIVVDDLRQALEQWDTSDMAHRPNGLTVDDDIQEYKRPWVGLTDEEINAIGYKYGAGGLDLMDELSAMLKEKNT
jgi:hypothetical protein